MTSGTPPTIVLGGTSLPLTTVKLCLRNGSQTIGIALTTSKPWYEATIRDGCAASPRVGVGLWVYALAGAGEGCPLFRRGVVRWPYPVSIVIVA